MSCARTRRLLDAWMDGELDAATRDEIAGHMRQCPGCETARVERETLRSALRAAAPRDPVPAPFTQRLRVALARESQAMEVRRRGPSWWQAAMLATGAAAAGALLAFAVLRGVPESAPLDPIVASHVAALARAQGQSERLVQVAASDRHVVKPWFQGKVDFSPPVRDLAADGFTLVGGRLDRVAAQPAAVIVYRIRNHPVELYAWIAPRDADSAVKMAASRGFGVATWSSGGLQFAAISDVEPRDLERFAQLLQAAL